MKMITRNMIMKRYIFKAKIFSWDKMILLHKSTQRVPMINCNICGTWGCVDYFANQKIYETYRHDISDIALSPEDFFGIYGKDIKPNSFNLYKYQIVNNIARRTKKLSWVGVSALVSDIKTFNLLLIDTGLEKYVEYYINDENSHVIWCPRFSKRSQKISEQKCECMLCGQNSPIRPFNDEELEIYYYNGTTEICFTLNAAQKILPLMPELSNSEMSSTCDVYIQNII